MTSQIKKLTIARAIHPKKGVDKQIKQRRWLIKIKLKYNNWQIYYSWRKHDYTEFTKTKVFYNLTFRIWWNQVKNKKEDRKETANFINGGN